MTTDKALPNEEAEGFKLHIDVLMTEYNALRSSIDRYRDSQGQLDNIALAGLGLSIPLIQYIIERNIVNFGGILLVSNLFFLIAFTQMRRDRFVFFIASYIDSILRPKTNNLLSKASAHSYQVMEYEAYLFRISVGNFAFHWLTTILDSGISIVIGLGMIVIHMYLRLFFQYSWDIFEILLLSVSIAAFLITISFAYFIARQRYTYLRRRARSPN
jgi:hypothetical protein